LALLQTITSRQKFERDLPKIVCTTRGSPSRKPSKHLLGKKEDDDDAKDAKDPRRCRSKSPLRRVFLEPRSLRKIFLGNNEQRALSFVREKKTFEEEEEEEEERKISLADSSVFFQKHPTNEGKKRRKKKEGKKTQRTHRYRRA